MKRLLAIIVILAAALPATATSIRTTSPGTIVFRGGAVVPRFFHIREVAGPYHIERNRLLLYAGYSPTPRTLLEIEAPFDWVSIRGASAPVEFAASGNATIWAKYRFYRAVEEWGDRHAAIRVGLALPTGTAQDLSALLPVIRPQLQPASGAWSPMLDLTYGQAIRRFVYHLNLQQTFAVERHGGRPGHMTRAYMLK